MPHGRRPDDRVAEGPSILLRAVPAAGREPARAEPAAGREPARVEPAAGAAGYPRSGAGSPPVQMVVRGGSWYDRPVRCRSAFRLAYPPYQKVFNVGFRVICEDAPARQTAAAAPR